MQPGEYGYCADSPDHNHCPHWHDDEECCWCKGNNQECPKSSPDWTHCNHWWDGGACCHCQGKSEGCAEEPGDLVVVEGETQQRIGKAKCKPPDLNLKFNFHASPDRSPQASVEIDVDFENMRFKTKKDKDHGS